MTSGIRAAFCGQAMSHLDEFIDDELETGEVRERIAAHLLACPGCRAAFDLEERLKQLVRRSCVWDAAPVEVRARIEVLRIRLWHTGN